MTPFPLVSVLCLARNHASFIEQSMQACTALDYPNLEIILIDNHSDDRTLELGEAILKKSSRPYKIHRFNTNIGIPKALNYALRHLVHGEYVCFTSGDDWMEPDNIKLKIDYIETHPEYKWVYSYGYFYFEDEKKSESIDVSKFREGFVFDELLKDNFLFFHGTVVSMEMLSELNYFDEKCSIEDWEFSLRAVQKYPIGLVRKPLFYYRRHSKNYSAVKSRDYYLDCMYVLRKYKKNKNARESFRKWNGYYIDYIYQKEKKWKSFFYILSYSFSNRLYLRTAISILLQLLFHKRTAVKTAGQGNQ